MKRKDQTTLLLLLGAAGIGYYLYTKQKAGGTPTGLESYAAGLGGQPTVVQLPDVFGGGPGGGGPGGGGPGEGGGATPTGAEGEGSALEAAAKYLQGEAPWLSHGAAISQVKAAMHYPLTESQIAQAKKYWGYTGQATKVGPLPTAAYVGIPKSWYYRNVPSMATAKPVTGAEKAAYLKSQEMLKQARQQAEEVARRAKAIKNLTRAVERGAVREFIPGETPVSVPTGGAVRALTPLQQRAKETIERQHERMRQYRIV